MIYLPSLYDYSWDVTLLEVQFCPGYPPLMFVEHCTGMMPFGVN